MDATVPDVNVVRIAVDLACRAPSVHNSQPWQWTYFAGRLDLHGDPSRLLASADPAGRQLVVSCGAALHHLEIALVPLQWNVSVERFPDGPESEYLAGIGFRHDARPHSHDYDLLAAIRHRCSDRRPFSPIGPKRTLPPSLAEIVRGRGARLTVLPAAARTTLAEATEITASARRYDSAYQTELHWWAGHSISSGGIPPDALTTLRNQARVGFGRRFPAGPDDTSSEEVDRSTVLVVSTESDGRRDWLAAGEALSAVLLDATVAGLATCPLTHITEIPRSRDMIRELLPDKGHPQALVRVGVTEPGSSPHRTPRRSLDSVFSTAPRRSRSR